MMPTTPSVERTVRLVDRAAGAEVGATLRRPLSASDLIAAEQTWGPIRHELSERQRIAGRTPAEHRHWSWARAEKTDAVVDGRVIAIGVESAGAWQGLMAVIAAPRPSRSWPEFVGRWFRRPVLYVDYLESAPWNNPSLTAPDPPRYGGVGTHLLIEAIRMSAEQGLDGRIGLHSLPQSARFYASRGMRLRLRADASYLGLPYFEYTENGARAFVARASEGRS